MKQDLNKFIPKEVKNGVSFNGRKFDRAIASNGDVDRFINKEQFGVLRGKRKSGRLNYLEREQAKTGKPFLYKERLVNPIKLNLSDSTMKKIKKEA